MRKTVPVLFLVTLLGVSTRPASADPLQVAHGAFVLDIEGDMFNLSGSNFAVATTGFGVYSTKQFPGRCDPSASPFGFCAEAEGSVVDWSFHTTGGEQLLGTGDAAIGSSKAAGLDFVGSVQMTVVPTRLSSGGTNDFDFIAPFTFAATIRGMHSGQEVFARQFAGRGFVNVNYEGTLRPGVFAAADETIRYDFTQAAPVPEPATMLLLGSGLAGTLLRRRTRA